MKSKIRRHKVVIALAVVLSLAIGLLVSSSLAVGVTSEVGSGGLPLSIYDLSAVPQSVAEDATRLATEMFGDCQEECNDFVNQLLAMYEKANDKDFVVIFNSGGWGSNLLETSSGWQSIFTGIESELASSGYSSLLLDYQRSVKTLRGFLDEFVERMSGYPSRGKDLAGRVEFLTKHNPELRVIITGESTGTIICDSVMYKLQNNPQVYSIQTGPPFWHENIVLDRTLLLTGNGIMPDSFSQGHFWDIVWGNLRYWLRLSQPEDHFDTTPHYVRSPGHDYWWQYPEVCSQITNFLQQNFGIKW
ncbi:MAG: hypothetical protein ACETVS_00575 [Dehalococcoidales bacterium]